MTRVVTVANQAGSVGKSTLVVSLAGLLAGQGRRVLVVDLDAQANATKWLGVDPSTATPYSGDVLLRRREALDAVVPSAVDGVLVMPGREDLAADLVALQNEASAVLRLRKPLAQVVAEHGVDVVLLDCPGSMTLVTWCALAASTSAVTVTTPAQKEIDGIGPFRETVAQVADELDVPVALQAIVPCMVPPANAGRVYVEALAWLRGQYDGLVTPSVRRAAVVAEAASHWEPVTTYAPDEPVSVDLLAVLGDLQRRGVV